MFIRFSPIVSNNPLADIINVVHDPCLMKPRRFGKWFYFLHYVTGFGKKASPFEILVELVAAKVLSDKIESLSAIKDPGLRTPVGGRVFSHPSRTAPRPSQLPVQRVPGISRSKAAGAWR